MTRSRLSFLLLAAFLLALAGCAHQSTITPSAGHIDHPKPIDSPERSLKQDIPASPRAVVIPPKPKAPTYSIVVSDVPVKEILFALARESKLNVDIHPAIHGNATLNAVNQTLPEILDRLANQVDLKYRMEGSTLFIAPDMPVLRTYKVDYVNMERDASGTLGVGSEISSGTAASNSPSGKGSQSVTTLTSKSKVNFWEVLGDNLRNILKSTRSQAAAAEDRAMHEQTLRLAMEDRIKQVEAASRAGAGAERLFQEAFRNQSQPLAEQHEDVILNPITGSVSVMGTERQQAYVRQYLDQVTSAAQRQVLIEATIVEVALNDTFKSGVDWSRLGSDGSLKGFTFRQNMSGTANLVQPISTVGAGATLLSTPGFILGYNNTNNPLGNIAASISWLQTFGETRVLSSPKIMAINNQSALLKVVDNVVYFKVEVTPATLSSTGTVISPATYSTTPQNVSVGVVMSVTPQIDDSGKVSINVRPTISRIIDFVNDPNPQLAAAGVTNPVPQIEVREMESMLQVGSGQTVVLGGLMQDEVKNADKNVPGLAKLPLIGKLFQAKNDARRKTELVIFLRPTVIHHASLSEKELQSFQSFMPEHAFPQSSEN